jgi:RNA polymerase sigma factor for flagellar operon FliA
VQGPAGHAFGRSAAEQDSELVELWAEFTASPSPQSRNALVIAYEPLVRSVVGRLPATVRTHWDSEDLISFGVFGLIDALRRWEPSSPIYQFAPYASKRIRGAIFDELRQLDWLPRSVRQRVIAYRSTVDALSSELGRTPENREVFALLNVDAHQGRALLSDVQSAQLLHLHHETESSPDEEDVKLVDLLAADHDEGPETRLLASERRDEVLHAIGRLPERERMVVSLHFLDGLTQEQVGKLLGVSNSRVCQIQASAVETLRRMLSSRIGPAESTTS